MLITWTSLRTFVVISLFCALLSYVSLLLVYENGYPIDYFYGNFFGNGIIVVGTFIIACLFFPINAYVVLAGGWVFPHLVAALILPLTMLVFHFFLSQGMRSAVPIIAAWSAVWLVGFLPLYAE